ncbi:sialidase-3-like isoform X2 [Amphiura filiformis]|uniref:sialidase-3-like isoform X2 n=1 Tax=Amphiura filiformis TaxID=82378 RepID=UPI003B223E40
MGMAKIKRMFLLGMMITTVGLVYFFVNSTLDLNLTFPLLRTASLDSMHRLKSRLTGEGVEGRLKDHCASEMLQNKTQGQKVSWISSRYELDRESLTALKKAAKLDVEKNYFHTGEQSLFEDEDFKGLPYPPFRPRIPAIVYYKDTFLVFCEARFDGVKDYGTMMITLRRGIRKGIKIEWEKIRLIASVNGFRTMNPSPIVDRQKDAIVLVFAAFPTDMSFHDLMYFQGHQTSKLLVMKSYDIGVTWTEPQDITGTSIGKIKPFPVLFVPGPGHSIQMDCGRIIVPGNFFTRDINGMDIPGMCGNCTNYSQVLYSDDGGTTWHVGGRTPFNRDDNGQPIHPNEIQAAELSGGVVYLNARTLFAAHPRSHTFSFDGGITLTDMELVRRLPEPGFKREGLVWVPRAAGGCAASVISFPALPGVNTPHNRWLLFSNPADNVDRKNLAVRLSVDGGQSWSEAWDVATGKAGYSDLTYFEAKQGELTTRYFALLYEAGKKQYNEQVRVQLFNMEALFRGLLTAEQGGR